MPAPAAVGRERSFAHGGEGLAADRRFVGGTAAWTGGGDGARLHGPQPSSTGPALASRRQGRPPRRRSAAGPTAASSGDPAWLGSGPPKTAERLANRQQLWRYQFLKLAGDLGPRPVETRADPGQGPPRSQADCRTSPQAPCGRPGRRQLREPAVAAGTIRCRPCRERRRSC